ncbi:MAG: hypothetical protein JNM30_05880 [Rhodospirillales bacterium]|nr:hypothetical protein [Rhodospirillales bacterium]
MRRLFLAFLIAVLAFPALAADDAVLRSFAKRIGLRDLDGFVATVQTIDRTGKLPRHYIRKDEAAKFGWRPGTDLCRIAPAAAIGGDRFSNRERLLPEKRGRRWYEADLDFACGRRNADRLVYSNDGLRFVSTDHYLSFHEVPK